MRDHPAPRLSSLPSMDSHPCLPRCSVCESLELTARSKGSSSSTWILPSSGFVCSFSHPVSHGPCFLPDKIADSLLFSLLSPSLPVVPTTGQRNIPLIFLLACYYLVAHPVGRNLRLFQRDLQKSSNFRTILDISHRL